MKLISKLNMTILIFSLHFAGIASADQSDPCSNIVSHWKGTYFNRNAAVKCNYYVDAVGEIRGQSVVLNLNLFNPM